MINLGTILGGNVGQLFKDVVGAFKIDPTKKAEFQAAIDENAALLAVKELELQSKIQDAVSTEVSASADIIKAEANSQSWLPRNVRPLLLLLWGCIITFNPLVAIISQFTKAPMQPITLDPWIYKLTAIGFTGYVAFRSWEKVKAKDT